jgi:hypothetical protein
MTRRWTITVRPSTVKDNSDHSASCPSASSIVATDRPVPPLSALPCPAAYSMSRRTPAADSTLAISIILVHTPEEARAGQG